MWLFMTASCLTMSVSLAYPDASLALWQHLAGKFAERRAKALARRLLENSARMKKYWVIDMSALPEKRHRP